MSTHEIKRNDTRPYWPVTLTFDDGTVPDLTGGTVDIIAKSRSNGVVKFKVAVVITDASAADVEWRPLAVETDEAGLFDIEWEAILADATKQTFPTRRYDRLKVIGDLG